MLKAGEMAQLVWYADDRSDDIVDPPARIRLVLTDAAQAAAWMAAGEAESDGSDIVLTQDWESPRPALSYVRVWAHAVGEALSEAGIATREDFSMSDRLDIGSVRRGLRMIDSLGRISVEDILERRQIYVSRAGTGPFVLEVTARQFARGHDWLVKTGLPLIRDGAGARLSLGDAPGPAIDRIVAALGALEQSPATTLVARYAPGPADPWPDTASPG